MGGLKLKAKAVFFDLDGTIIDSKEAYLTAMKTALSKMGEQDVNVELAAEIPRRLEQNLPISDLVKGLDVKRFLEHYLSAYYQATATKSRPMPSISNVLEKLSGRAKLAVITMRNVPKERVIEELAGFNLAHHFQCVLTAFDTNAPKPSPEALVKCAKQLHTTITQCVIVGDSVTDIRAGKNAGTKTVAVTSGIFSRQELQKEKPDLILESVQYLPDFLE